MADEHHFLSRLERLRQREVELALSLYRDTRLVRFVLTSVRLPDNAGRVAISLGDPITGPFVVVTRQGDFVTCLGEGMTVGALPVISRAQLDSYGARYTEQRGRIEEATAWAGERGGLDKIIQAVIQRGPDVSREQIAVVSAFGPLYAQHLWRWAVDALDRVRKMRVALLPRAKWLVQPDARDSQRLRTLWTSLWAASHLLAVAAEHSRFAPDIVKEMVAPYGSLTWSLVRYGVHGHLARSMFVAGRIGRPMLSPLKERLGESRIEAQMWDSALGLAAIGLRHSKFSAETRKALASCEVTPHTTRARGAAQLVADPEKYDTIARFHLSIGMAVVASAAESAPRGHWLRDTNLDDVSDDVLMAAGLMTPANLYGDNSEVELVLAGLGWAARASLVDLYLPEKWLTALRMPYCVESPARLISVVQDQYGGPAQPFKKETTQGRNERCACNSGKKFKRCCGTVAAGAEV